jgi:hypothetical protein
MPWALIGYIAAAAVIGVWVTLWAGRFQGWRSRFGILAAFLAVTASVLILVSLLLSPPAKAEDWQGLVLAVLILQGHLAALLVPFAIRRLTNSGWGRLLLVSWLSWVAYLSFQFFRHDHADIAKPILEFDVLAFLAPAFAVIAIYWVAVGFRGTLEGKSRQS